MSVVRFALFALMVIGFNGQSNAALLLFSDNFNANVPTQLGVTSLAAPQTGSGWVVTSNVDVLDSANPGFSIPHTNGVGAMIDLAGTGSNSVGALTTVDSFGVSVVGTNKTVSVKLAGNGRENISSLVRLTLGSWTQDIVLSKNDR